MYLFMYMRIYIYIYKYEYVYTYISLKVLTICAFYIFIPTYIGDIDIYI